MAELATPMDQRRRLMLSLRRCRASPYVVAAALGTAIGYLGGRRRPDVAPSVVETATLSGAFMAGTHITSDRPMTGTEVARDAGMVGAFTAGRQAGNLAGRRHAMRRRERHQNR